MVDPIEPEARSAAPSELSWSTWPEACRLVLIGRTRRPALRIALIVGTLLTLFYQGEALFTGDLDIETGARIVFNYCLPYVVSSIGFLVPLPGPPPLNGAARQPCRPSPTGTNCSVPLPASDLGALSTHGARMYSRH